MDDDRDAQFEKLYEYYPAVVAFLRRWGFTPEDSRDLAQEVFVRVYEHMSDYRGESQWLYLQRVARNLALNTVRDLHAAKRQVILESEEKFVGLIDEKAPSPYEVVKSQFDAQWLRHAVDQLGEKLRTTVLLYLADFPYTEIERILDISEAAVKSRLNATRKQLRELWQEELQKRGGSDG